MYIEHLEVSNVRNLSNVQIETNPGVNFFFGENAAGKTAVLESIHLLSRAKSFRSSRFTDVLSFGQDSLTVTTGLFENNRKIITGINKKKGETTLQFAGKKVKKASDQAKNIPLFIITTESHKILNGSPRSRRHWLDWSMFHVEQDYMMEWQQYYLALRHRNALLRKHTTDKEYEPWEETMVDSAIKINKLRQSYINNLQKKVNSISQAFFGDINISLQQEENLREALKNQRDQDKRLGYTSKGPHSTDVFFNIDGRPIKNTLSRGRAKLFLIFLISSQVIEYIDKKGRRPVLMVDDIAAELDTNALGAALRNLAALGAQVFINSVQKNTLESLDKEAAMFHVEHGNVRKMVE